MPETVSNKSPAKGGNGKARAPMVAEARRREDFMQVNMIHRIKAAPGTTTADLEHPDYLGAIATQLVSYDRLAIVTEDGKFYWEALVTLGGFTGSEQGGGRALMKILPGFPIELPEVDFGFVDGIPAGYSIEFDSFTRRHIPKWGETRLDADGMHTRSAARDCVNHHRAKSASNPPRPPK